jgi:hypothetical protein
MSALEKFAGLLHQGPSIYRPSMERFPPLDINRLEEELKIKENARERGVKELPRSDAESPDAEELTIRRRIEEEALQARDHVSRELKSLNARVGAYRLEGKRFLIETIAKDAVANFRSAADQGVNQLTLDLQRARDNHKHRRKFKLENRLERPVKESSGTVLKVGILLLLGLFETGINGTYFATGLDAGIVGGISVALCIAALNIFIGGVAGGIAFREVRHVRPIRKVSGLLGIAAYSVLLVGFNLMVSQYRLALQGEFPEQAAGIAWNAIVGLNLSMDFDGLIVTVVGIVFSAIAAFDVFAMRDAYPGYSRVENAYRTAAQDYSYDQRDVIEQLGEIKDASVAQLKMQRESLPIAAQNVEAAMAEAKQLVDEYKTYLRSMSQVTTAMVRRYRDDNAVSRTTPVPAYFHQPVEGLGDGASLDGQVPYVDSQGQAALMLELSETLSGASNTIFSEFDAVQNRFSLLEDIFSEKEGAEK